MGTRRRDFQVINEYSWILENGDQANQGEQAGIDTATGTMRPMGSSATQIFMGHFAETLLGTGSKKVRVTVPNEIEAEWLNNDTNPNDIAANDIGSEVYSKDARTVSTLAAGRSKAGRVIDYDASGNKVLVQGGTAVTGPAGAGSIFGSVADRAALKALGSTVRSDGQTVLIRSDNSLWRFDSASAAAADGADECVIVPTVGTGRWVRADKSFIMKIPINKDLADGAVIFTTPHGFVLRPTGLPFWDDTTAWAGGAASAIGIASSKAGYNTPGDILGGATGDVAAGLGLGVKAGTIGTKFDTEAEMQAFFMEEGDELTFEKITSAFTAGAGFVCMPVAAMVPA